MEAESTLTSKGQLTVPKEIRELLGLKEGRKVLFIVRGQEAVMVPKPRSGVADLQKLRSSIKFTEEQLKKMIKESKQAWGE